MIPSGKNPWNRTAVHYILRNVAYTGKTYLFTRYKTEAKHHLKTSWQNKLTHMEMRPREEWLEAKGATPAIISEELFNQVQQKLMRNKELALRNARREYLLSGYVFCETCDRRYLARKNTGSRSYYKCPRCKGKGLNADRIEAAVWNKIEEALSKPELVLNGIEMLRNEQNKGDRYQRELDGIDTTIRHLDKEKDRVWKAFMLTGDEGQFTSEVKPIMSRIDELKTGRVELEKKLELISDTEVNVEAIQQYCEMVNRNLSNLTFAEKRNALEALRIRVMAGNEQITIEGTIPIVSSQCA